MGFSFTQRRDAAQQVRKIAAEQIDSAIEICANETDFDKAVHDLRRHCKKVRGLMRLVRPNFDQFELENATFRDAADSLSSARDANVTVETFDTAMKEAWAEAIDPAHRAQLRQGLLADQQQVAEGQDQSKLLADFAATMDKARKRVEQWDLHGEGFDLLVPGLRHIYAGMRKRMKKAARSGNAADFHEWRKFAKSHGFHVSLLADSAPDLLGTRKKQLGELGDYLGSHHDLAVLSDRLTQLAGTLDPAIAQGLAGQRQALADKALALGEQLAVESPAMLTSRFSRFWKLLPKED